MNGFWNSPYERRDRRILDGLTVLGTLKIILYFRRDRFIRRGGREEEEEEKKRKKRKKEEENEA